MKKILLGVALIGATTSAALAADLPSRRAPPPVYIPPPVPVFTWTGFYLGGNAGYAFDGDTSFNGSRGFARTRASGFTGGGQVGYNVQIGNTPLPLLGGFGGGGLVVGVEADAAYTDLKKSAALGTVGYNARTDFVGTARGRVGLAFGNLLVFGTGGFAYGSVRNSIVTPATFATTDSIRTGYTYGGGIEYAIPTASFVNIFHSSAVTLKAEYLHYDLGTQSIPVGTGSVSAKNSGNLVRAGINYKLDLFGGPAAPVVARY